MKETVTSGAEANVLVKIGVVTLLRKKFDICDQLEKHKDEVELQCPIEKGNLTVSSVNIMMIMTIMIMMMVYPLNDPGNTKGHIAKGDTQSKLCWREGEKEKERDREENVSKTF